MYNNIIIKEIKNFEIYNSNDKLIRHKFSLTGVGLIHNNSSVAKLQGIYHGYTSTEQIECYTKLYKIKGKAVIQDVDTCGIYEGNFTANHVIFIKDDNLKNELVMILLKIDDNPMYRIDINVNTDEYIDEYKVKLNMPCYKESYLLEFNQIIEKILDKSTYTYSVEEAELVKDLMKLSKKYKEKRISKFV